MTWTAQLIGKSYSKTGQGPDEFNCWALVREGLKLGHGIDVPMLDIGTDGGWRAAQLRGKMNREWKVITTMPRAADIVSMVGVRRELHVGMFLDSIRVLHTSADSREARVQRFDDFRYLGFDRFEVWRRTA